MNNSDANVRPELFFWTAILLVAFLVFQPIFNHVTLEKEDGDPLLAAVASERPGVATGTPYEDLEISAYAAIVYDMTSGETLYERNADEVRPLASLTKLVTAATALSLIPATTNITLTPRAIAQEGDSGFRVGEQWLLRDLISLALLESSNDAAFAIAAEAGKIGAGTEHEEVGYAYFIDRMNLRVQQEGLLRTYFLNATGLDLTVALGGAYGTARELALILAKALREFPEAYAATRFFERVLQNGNREGRTAQNTNPNTDRFPLLIASKTGYTDLAGGNLALAFDAGLNRPVVIVVLGSTRTERFYDAEKLVWSTLEYLTRNRN